ncbi:MAG: ABC transporter permease, partial [Asgard group archaeon]|nr:ABC transporter permease [Asgard group archaeon]
MFSRVGNLKILLSYLNANRKSLFMKVVTIAIVTISVSCSFFFLDSFQPQFSLRYMNTIKAKQSDAILSFDYSLEDYLEDGETIDELIYADMLANNFSSQFEETFGKNTLSLISVQKSTNAFSYLDGYNSTLAIVNANNLALELLKDYSVEENCSVGLFDGGILLLEENVMKYSPDSALFNESNLILSNGFSDIAQHNFSIDFHAKVLWDYESTFSQNITKIIGETSCAIVVSDAIFKDYLMFVNTSTSLFDISSSVYLDIDYSTISFNDQSILKEQLSQFVTFAQGFILGEYSLSAEFSYELNFLSFLNELRDVLIIIYVLILIFTIPIILFSLLILLFSNDFFARKRSKLFSFYYSKGSSIRQLFLIVFSENILALFLALVFGIGLSLPFTKLMVNYPNFLRFQEVAMFQSNYSFTINPFNIFWIVLIVAISGLLLVLIDLKPIISQEVTQKELETEDDFEQKIASWKKFYFDFLLLIAGLGILLFERILQSLRDDFITQFFVYFIGILVIIVAMALLFLRFAPNFLSSTGNYLWRKIGSFFSFITRLFKTRKKALARNILSFVLCVSYLLALVQMVSAIDHFSTEQAYFTVGADARIDFSSESNITAVSSALPSTIHSTEITKLHLKNHLLGDRLTFYSIDTDTFLSVAY